MVSSEQPATISVGRGHSSDLRLTDITVSRTHAVLKVVNGEFYLTDTKSKFGTLLLMRRPVELRPNHLVSLQAGRTKLSFMLHQPATVFQNQQEYDHNSSCDRQPAKAVTCEEEDAPSVAELQLGPGGSVCADKETEAKTAAKRRASM